MPNHVYAFYFTPCTVPSCPAYEPNWAASTSKKRSKELPCLLMCPSRCLPALDSSLGIIPT